MLTGKEKWDFYPLNTVDYVTYKEVKKSISYKLTLTLKTLPQLDFYELKKSEYTQYYLLTQSTCFQ